MRRSLLLASTAACLLSGLAAPAHAEEEQEVTELSDVVVMGKRVIRESAGATGLDLSLRETPQSVTVVSAETLRQYNLTDANQLLSSLPGINVEVVETDRTYYNSRGFDIVNFQVDGIGQPLDWGFQAGALDLAIYDRIEAIRGANGLTTAVGNPSATLNYIRKRPTQDFSLAASAGYGSWDTRRLTADVSGPLNDSGTVKARFVYANTDGGSHLDYYDVNRNVYYAIGSWDITPKLNATAGFSRQDNLASGVNWGNLPLVFSDGTPIDYSRSATTAAPWTYWDTHHDIGFGELSYAFDNGWTVKAIYTHRRSDEKANLLYASGTPDRVTGAGVTAYSGIYPSDLTQDMFDAIANGEFNLFGRTHQLALGFNASRNETHKNEASTLPFPYPAWQGGHITPPARPVYTPTYLAERVKTKQSRAFAAAHLNLTDQLKVLVGANAVDIETSGFSYGTPQDTQESKVNPYLGVVFDVNRNLSLYGSYSDLFLVQNEGDINRQRLAPVEGTSLEAGIKSEWFNSRLYATAAIFQSEQKGLAEFAGTIPGTADYYHVGVDTKAKGYEFEVTGRPTPQWTIAGGFTHLKIEDKDGKPTRRYVPENSLKLQTSYSWPQWRNLTLGGAVRWQDDIHSKPAGFEFKQEAYAVVDLAASVDLTDNIRASLNAKNLSDETYWASLQWDQAQYAPPRSVMFTLDYRY